MDSDAETLDAVVAFLDAYEADVGGFDEPCASASPCSDRSSADEMRRAARSEERKQQRRVEKRVHRNRARGREKRELLGLRVQVEELQKRYAQLVASSNYGKAGVHESGDRELVAAWENVALRQAKRRRDAEDEHAQLAERVAEQWNVLKSLKRIIERQFADVKIQPQVAAPIAVKVNSSRSDIFARLLAGSTEMYACADQRILSLSTGPLNETRIHTLSPTQILVKSVDHRLIPSDVRAASDAYWSVLVGAQCATFCFVDESAVIEGRDTLIRGQAFYDDDKVDADAKIHRQAYTSVQKFVEKDRVVMTNMGQSEFVEVDTQVLPGMRISEQYWHVFERRATSSSCSMISSARVVLDFQPDGSSYARPLGCVLAKYFGSRLPRMMDLGVAGLEDRLLQKGA